MIASHLTGPLRQAQAVMALAVVLGGGGVVYGWRHMAIELAALILLALHPGHVTRFVREQSGWLLALVAATVLWPLLQAVPLPASWWQALPGRDVVTQAYAAAGIAPDSWFSFSIDPMRSLVAFCATLVPLSLIVTGAALPQNQRIELAWTLVTLAGLALLLGAVQLSSGNTIAMLNGDSPHANTFYALFSNRNSTGIFFVITALVLLALPWPRSTAGLTVYATAVGLVVLAVLLTQSRSAIALAALIVPFAAWRLFEGYRRQRRTGEGTGLTAKRGLAAGVLVALLAIAAVLSVTMQGRLAAAAERFGNMDGDRLEMWDDAQYVAGRYWPTGAGTGAFDDVFQVDESLEYVSPAMAGRAHNDYLELAVELGLPGLLLLGFWWVWLGVAGWKRRRDPDYWLARAAFLSFVAVALQSALDYPLRNHAMLAVAGLLVVLLLPPRARQEAAA